MCFCLVSILAQRMVTVFFLPSVGSKGDVEHRELEGQRLSCTHGAQASLVLRSNEWFLC